MYPPGIVTRTCTVGGATAQESGDPLILSVVVASSRGLIWASTGWRLPSLPRTVASTVGSEATFELPVTSQAGFRSDSSPGTIIDVSAPGSYSHTYTATVTITTPTGGLVSQHVIGPFPLPAEDLSPVDLDTLLPVGTQAGGVVLVPDTWGPIVAAAEAALGEAVDLVGDVAEWDARIAAAEAAAADAAESAAGAVSEVYASSTYAARLSWTQAIHRNGIANSAANAASTNYMTFSRYYHVYDTGINNTGAVYALAQVFGGALTQGVWRSLDGGDTWAKLFDLTIDQPAGVWYEDIFVEPFQETIYLQKTTTAGGGTRHNYVESWTAAGALIGSRDVGASSWISGSHTIDAGPNAAFSARVVIFGEYAQDSKSVVNLWRTTDRGATWTSVLSLAGNAGVVGSGEARHCHVIARDPFSGHWWAGFGDADHQCAIYRSQDEGVTWTELWSGSQRERTTSFVFTPTHAYYGMDSAQPTLTHSKIVRITKATLERADVATVKGGLPVWALTKTYAPAGVLIWTSCEYVANIPPVTLAVQWLRFDTGTIHDVAHISMPFTSGTEGFRSASRHMDLRTGRAFVEPTAGVRLGQGFNSSTVSDFLRATLSLGAH